MRGWLLGVGVAVTLSASGPDGDPLVYQAWGFVRQVSTNLGSAAQSVLGVQASLNQLEVNFTSESDGWQHVKTQLTSEHDRLAADLARLQEQARAQQLQGSEVGTLQAELAQLQTDANTADAAAEAAKARVAQEEAELVKQQEALEAQLKKVQNAQSGAAAGEFAAVAAMKQSVADLEQQVYANTQLLQATKQAVSAARSKRAARQAELYKRNIFQQQANAKQELELVTTTKEALNVKALRDTLTRSDGITSETARGAAEAEEACDLKHQSLEGEVRAQVAELQTLK